MNLRKTLLATAILLAGVHHVLAGPFKDAEARIADAYADYRVALYQTNQKNQQATDAALASFRSKWTALSAAMKATPAPQYADDPKFADTLTQVAQIAEEAAKQASAGDLTKSHETLEGIRDALGNLRARNNVVVFSDHMNAYHEVMERVVDHKYDSKAELGEDVAVLRYLLTEIGKNRPAGVGAEFEQGFKVMEGTLEALRTALRSGDDAALAAARKATKPAYSKMFQKFG